MATPSPTHGLEEALAARVDQLWNRFWSGGIANPLTAIEQITYLIFLRMLEELEHRPALASASNLRALLQQHPDARWSHIKLQAPDEMFRLVRDRAFPMMQALGESDSALGLAMRDAAFLIPKPSLLAAAVKTIDALPLTRDDTDLPGDIYEALLAELSLSGRNGQFRTPRQIVGQLAAAMQPRLGERICDPAAGTGGFLVGAHRWTRSATGVRDAPDLDGRCHHGYDFDTTMVRLGSMNLLLHGMASPQLRYQDTLSASFDLSREYDVVLANPPFTGSVEMSELRDDLKQLGTGRSEILFTALCLDLLRTDGRAAIIVPEGVLFGGSTAHLSLRRRLLDEGLVGIVSLPGGAFRPYTGVKTSVLLVDRRIETDRIWFFEAAADASVGDASNDIGFIAEAYRTRDETGDVAWSTEDARRVIQDQTWWVDRATIEERHLVLAAASHRTGSRSGGEGYEDPRQLLEALRETEQSVAASFARIARVLHEL